MEPELIATLMYTGIDLYRVYCEGCKEEIMAHNVKSEIKDKRLEYTCPDCGHHVKASIK